MSETSEPPAGTPAPAPETGRVVVGVDGSPHSFRALDRAADEAYRRGAELEVLCGGSSARRGAYPETEADRERLRQATGQVAAEAAERARKRTPGLTVVATGVSEPAADALVHRSRTAQLTVVGTRGHGGFRGLLLGSVSLRLAAHAAGPLMVVRGEMPEPGATPGETVVGLKWEGATQPVEFGFRTAERSGSPLWVVHCWIYPMLPGVALRLSPKEPSTETRRAEQFVEDTLRPFRERYPNVRLGAEQHQGQAAEHLIKLSEGADMVVLGVRRQQRRLGLQLGPVVHAVLQHAKCSVVLVPVS
ncbi:universal stress protein [Streptomyces smyrnaeus]|uniref:Universal stress protein n=1 Tax=Streptomyces smyrnaeus TaxID=1387713 RepID=A0ABS3XNT0_9ACTN|nr:universal stress protein [Streptomyces smyrnaeus]MBO8197059.1 universal stress protein [Streptomyces smyrnaeus]